MTAVTCQITDEGLCTVHKERIGYRCVVAIRVLESEAKRIADLEAERDRYKKALLHRDNHGEEYASVLARAENAESELAAAKRVMKQQGDRAEKAEAEVERLRAFCPCGHPNHRLCGGERENGPSLPKEATPETDDEAADRIMREGEPSGVSPSPLCEHVFSRYGVPSDYCSICGAKAAAERPAEADPHWLCWDEPCSECEEEEAAAAKAAARHYADCICTECEAARKEG